MGCSTSSPVATGPSAAPPRAAPAPPAEPTAEELGLHERHEHHPASAPASASAAASATAAPGPGSPRPTARSLEVKRAAAVPVSELVSRAATAGGVAGVVALMRAHTEDEEFALWSMDALAGLGSGHAANRELVYAAGGVALTLAAMRLFAWDENVQTKACWLLATLSAEYAEFVGKSGGVDAVAAGMRACPEAYQVLTGGVRALQNLVAGSDVNRERASRAGVEGLLEAALERYAEDGQLQWRGRNLLARLRAPHEHAPKPHGEPAPAPSAAPPPGSATPVATPSGVATEGLAAVASSSSSSPSSSSSSLSSGAGAAPGPRSAAQRQYAAEKLQLSAKSSWSHLRRAIFEGSAKRIAAGLVPGLHGVSAQVAERAALPDGRAVPAVVAFLRAHRGYHEAEAWCADALSTLLAGDAAARRAAFEAGAIALLLEAMRGAVWEEEVQLKCLWALLALAGEYGAEVGLGGHAEEGAGAPGSFADAGGPSAGEGVRTIVGAMVANRTAHAVQVAGVKLLSMLTMAGARGAEANAAFARGVSAVKVVRAVIAAHASDPQLAYRGVNLLERLEPGVTLKMPRVALVRSHSMRVEEMASGLRLSAAGAAAAGKEGEDGDGTDFATGPPAISVSAPA